MAIADEVLPTGLAAALRRPPGARFHRVALQVNPYAYLVRHAKATRYQDESGYNDAIVSACLRHAIEAIAVADHFRIETSARLVAAARAAGIVVFPGFEAVSKEGVHLLCVFDTDRPAREIERIVGGCGVHNDADLSPLSDLDTQESLAKARSWDALLLHESAARRAARRRPARGRSR